MKIGVSLYSYHKYAEDKKGVINSIEKAVQMGFKGLDFVEVGLGFEDYLNYAKDINRLCKDLKIEPVCFCTYADFLNCSDILQETNRVKRNIDIAAAYGCSVFRHDISRGFSDGKKDDKSYDRAIEIIAPAIRDITKYAEDRGIINTTENHGFFSQDSARIKKLIDAVNEKNFGALVDIGNFCCADEDPVAAVKCLAPFARHAHAKDFHLRDAEPEDVNNGYFRSRAGRYIRGAIIGKGDIPVKECLSAFEEVGYNGYLTLEFEGVEDALCGIEEGYNALKAMLGA